MTCRVNGRACAPAKTVGALTVNILAGVCVRLTNKESLKSDRYRKFLAPLRLVSLPDQILESFVERTSLGALSAPSAVSSLRAFAVSNIKPVRT
jgi:hypothetical protein